jgi:hypothetical protein
MRGNNRFRKTGATPSKRVIGHRSTKLVPIALTLESLDEAAQKFGIPRKVVFDNSSEFVSSEFRRLLARGHNARGRPRRNPRP